jgi:hypothetical protein
MYVFGEIDKSSTVIENNIVNYTHNLNTSSAGIQSVKIVSGSINTNYWNSLNVMFYTSGSPVYSSEGKKFARPSTNFSIVQKKGSQFLTKYHGYPSSSIITIPSTYYGEKIKEKSFRFTDLNNPDNSGNNPVIVDDGFGNLYSTNAHHSQSNTNASSSDNYVGNIFYEHGLAVITETGSWSGSVDYSDLVTNYTLEFESVNTITSYEYNVTLLPQEYNLTTNYTIRNVLSGSTETFSQSTPFIASPFTGSGFQPYITTINLYQNGDYDTPVIQATLPRPIKKSDKINTRFKIKLDI